MEADVLDGSITADLYQDRIFGQVHVGRGTYIGGVRFRTYSNDEKIFVGRYCSNAIDIIISAGGNHRYDLPSTWPVESYLRGVPNPTRSYRPTDRHTTIGHDVWIGYQAIIAGGVHVGDGAVIGCGAVVIRDIPPYSIAVGNPARVIRSRFSAEQVEDLLRISWWNWSPETIRDRLEWFYLPTEEFIKRCGSGGSG